MLALAAVDCSKPFDAEVSTNVTTDNLLNSGYSGALLQMRGSYQRLANVLDDVTVDLEVASDNAEETGGHTSQRDLDYGEFYTNTPEINVLYAGLHDARGQADLFLRQYIDRYDLSLNYTGGAVPIDVRRKSMTAYATLVRGWSALYLGLIFDKVNFNRGPRQDAQYALVQALADFAAIDSLYASASARPEPLFEGIDIQKAAHTLAAKAQLQLGNYDAAVTMAQSGYTSAVTGGKLAVFYAAGAGDITTVDGSLIYTHVGNRANTQKLWCMNKWFLQNDSLDVRIALDSTTTTGAKFTFNGSNDLSLFKNYALGYTFPRVPAKYDTTLVQGKGLRILSWQDNTLIWAEALVRRNDLASGIAKLNEVRAAARTDKGAPLTVRSASTQTQALDDVLSERRVEFMAELGDRFISLRRFGVKHTFGGVDHKLPIPATEP